MIRTSAAVLVVLLTAAPAIAEPVAYDFDKSHASLVFSYNHLGYSTTDGRFNDWNGELVIDQETPANSRIAMTVNVDSLATFWDERDAHFKNADFFEVEAHPTATFVSTTVEKTGENTLSVAGELTIKGIAKPATFDVTINTIGEHPMAKTPAVGLDARTVVKRSDYGMDMFVPYVGDEVTISFSAEALKAK